MIDTKEISNDATLVIDTGAGTSPTREEILPLPILSDGHPKLAVALKEFDETQINTAEIQKFIKQLKMTMKTYNGVGLSANQCGFSFRMFVMGGGDFETVCINPRIVDITEDAELVRKREGCLSYPGLFLYVPRYESIQVEYTDETGQVVNTWLSGITAQVYQHELDHMNGIVYTEKVGPLAQQMARKRQAKLIKKIKKQYA